MNHDSKQWQTKVKPKERQKTIYIINDDEAGLMPNEERPRPSETRNYGIKLLVCTEKRHLFTENFTKDQTYVTNAENKI